MICEQCRQQEAAIHFTQVINGEKTELNLCADCAREHGAFSFETMSNLLSGLLEGSSARAKEATDQRCSRCGMPFSQFQNSGMLGCAQCYLDFRKQLAPVLQRIHGRLQHEGHVPATAGDGLKLRRQIDARRREMHSAIEQEDFERAAALRDELRELQAKLDAQAAQSEAKEANEHA